MQPVNALISDADGTLVDTVALIRHGQHEAAVTFLEARGVHDIPTYEDYAVFLNRGVGGSARQTLERTITALYEDNTHRLTNTDFDELHDLLNPIQDRLAPDYIKAYPGLTDLLVHLGKASVRLAIVSSGTPHHIVRNFGVALGDRIGDYRYLYQDKTVDDDIKLQLFTKKLQQTFGIPHVTVVTADDVGEKTKPDPLCVSTALERLGVTADQAIMLGDHGYDIKAGLNAGVSRAVGISHGFENEEVLRTAGASTVLHSLAEVCKLFKPEVV